MPTPVFFTYDGDTASTSLPYRPGIGDVGGGQKLDDADWPPDPQTMFTAADFNQMSLLFVALCKLTPAAMLLVANGGTPAVVGVRAGGSLLASADFAVIDHGPGDTEVKCPATKIMQPFAGLGFPQKTGDYRVSAYVNTTNDGIRVETRNGSGALADVDFLLVWV